MGVAACCGQTKKITTSVQRNGRLEPVMKDGAIVNDIDTGDDYKVETNDNDAAINYALRRNKSSKKENHAVKELLFSAVRLPSELKGRPMTFMVLFVNLHTLDDYDKAMIGHLSPQEIKDINDEE